MKVYHETNLTKSHSTMLFIIYESQILVKLKSVDSKKVYLLHLKRNRESI